MITLSHCILQRSHFDGVQMSTEGNWTNMGCQNHQQKGYVSLLSQRIILDCGDKITD